MRVLGTIAAVCACSPFVVSQVWSPQDLRDHVPGFHQPEFAAVLHQVAELVAHRDEAFGAICATIQGDHREYLLKIERLLDRLADDRWAVREDAERQLVEIGARGMAQIAARKESGKTLEERIRSTRIEEQIAIRGTEEEQAETRVLRGLVLTAPYLGPDERLATALVSATGHTDPAVVEGALRALGAVGSDDNADLLVARLRATDETDLLQRRTVLAALGELRGSRAIGLLAEFAPALSRNEALGVGLDARSRADAQPVLRALREHPDPIVAAAAAIELPPSDGAKPEQVKLVLDDGATPSGPLLAIRSDEIRIGGFEGLATARVPRQRCTAIVFDHQMDPPAAVRVFTTGGSLLTGTSLVLDDTRLVLESSLFGSISLPRAEVQGVAIDPALDRLVGASAETDRVRFKEGASLADGTVVRADAAGVVLRGKEAERTIPLEAVAGILFRRPPATQRGVETFTRVDVTTGDRLLVNLAAVDVAHAGFVMPGVGPSLLPLSKVTRVEFEIGGGTPWGFTLIADYSENAIIELDEQRNVVFRMDDVYGVWDAECLDNGNLLIVEFALGRVTEMTRDRKEVWSFDKLKSPYDADRLPNGNTLIADTYGDRVIEVDRAGQIVWSYDKEIRPLDVERLENGNTLIADGKRDRVLEVDRSGQIVWQVEKLEGVWDVDRLPNGNTLVTQRRQSHRVFEMDRDGRVVWEIRDLMNPSDADRLPNGHTIVAEDAKVREFDRQGNVVWEYPVAWAVEVNRY